MKKIVNLGSNVETIFINHTSTETRVAVMDDNIVQDILIERNAARGLVGNVYWGKVVRVLPGMQSAFIDIGLERTAFLHVADIEQANRDDLKPIEYLLHDGQALLVQVSKDPIGTKGARLTTTISLAGRKLVYLPRDTHVGVSQRIEDEALRERLREDVLRLRHKDEKGGYIIRTSAEEGASEAEFLEDMRYLGCLWKEIREKTAVSPVPSLLYEDLFLAQRVLRDMVQTTTERIVVDDEALFKKLCFFAKNFVPSVLEKLHYYDGEMSLFEVNGIDEEIERSLKRRVDLKSGGYLVFDQNEAMSTIDVNTGGYVGKRDFGDTVFKTNLEAAETIARQLRLRNLGGIVIIDFIDMNNGEHQQAVLAALRRALEKDKTKKTVSEFTELGLVEMTRKRTRESLSHVMCEPCPMCSGRGEIKTSRTVCYEILREVAHMARQYPDAKEFRISAQQNVIDMFLEQESMALEVLQTAINKPILLEVESIYTQEQYDVILA